MKNWQKRALRTFAQTAFGYVLGAVPALDFADTSYWKTTIVGIIVSAIAAGLSAVMNIMDEANSGKDE